MSPKDELISKPFLDKIISNKKDVAGETPATTHISNNKEVVGETNATNQVAGEAPATNQFIATSQLIENKDYYLENGFYVFTAEYLKNRGYCCKSGCRHCPY